VTRSRGFYGWQVVTAAIVGAAISPATLVNVPFSLFIPALEAEFHWSRPTITAALSVFLALLVVSLPAAGRLVDRLGARRVALPSVLAYGLALASVSLLGPSTAQFYVHYGVIAVLGAGAQSLTLIRVLTTWFERRRGLAIGACMAGYGIGYVLVPLLAQTLIAAWGWRAAYAGLGALAVLGALPMIALLLHDSPAALGVTPGDGTEVRPAPERATTRTPAMREALRTREFWLLAAIFVLMSAALNGVQAQIVPLLTDRGLSAATAALMLSAIGVGSFPARLLVGFFLDRVFAPYVAAACFGLSALALAWLIGASAPLGIALVAIAVGLSLGAENDILGYLTGRYFSLDCFGRVYGALLGAYLLGAAAGPYAMARAYALAGNYTPALRGGGVAIVIACILLFLLPRYTSAVVAPEMRAAQ
jgi:sugar phosphate permease